MASSVVSPTAAKWKRSAGKRSALLHPIGVSLSTVAASQHIFTGSYKHARVALQLACRTSQAARTDRCSSRKRCSLNGSETTVICSG